MQRLFVSLTVVASLAGQQTLPSRTLLATVTDTGNRQLYDLEADDFVIDERGVSREVLSVHLADYPIGVLLDNGGDSAQLEAIKLAAVRFISRSGDRPLAVAGLADVSTLPPVFDIGREKALDAVARLKPSAGEPLPLDSAAAMARAIREIGAPFSAVVIISAQPVDSAPGTRGELLTTILESGTTVHVVAYRAANPAASQQNDVLRALVDQTHGQFTTIYSSASYAIALDRLSERLATEMMIEYVLPPGTAPGGDVRVGVKIPGAKVKGLGVR